MSGSEADVRLRDNGPSDGNPSGIRPTDKPYYPGIDVLKLVAALLVLLMHVVPHLSTVFVPASAGGVLTAVTWTDIIKSVTGVGVPFFFIASGFFFGSSLQRADDKAAYYFRWFRRIFLMYCIWTVLTTPVFVYDLLKAKPGMGPVMIVLYILRGFFLSGSMGIYWYLLSLLCVSVLLYFADSRPVFRVILYVFSVVLFVVGLMYAAGTLPALPSAVIHVLFGSERNFLNVGLFYMCLGYFLSRRTLKLPKLPVLLVLLGVLLLLTVGDCFVFAINFVYPFAALVMFLCGLVWKPQMKVQTTLRIRRLSTGIYLLHFPFIILFDFYLERGILLDFVVTLAFCVAVFSLAQLLPQKVRSLLFG